MINYAASIFTRTYKHSNKELYATFHPEVIVERDGYESTGRYLVVLLHPEKGLQSFFLNKDNKTGKWAPKEDEPDVVEQEFIDWCNKQIEQ